MGSKLFIALDNIRSAENVGSMLRSSDAFNVDKVFFCGITPTSKDKKVLKTSLGAEKSVKTEYKKDILLVIEKLKNKGFEIVSLEQTKSSTDIAKYKLKRDILLIVGNEVSGVSKEVLDISSKHIHIPMHGKKESLNVSVAFGIAAYQISKHLH